MIFTNYRNFLVMVLILVLAGGCVTPLQPPPSILLQTITQNPNSTPTPTPFQPAADTPLPTASPTHTPSPLPTLTPSPTLTPMPPTRMPADDTDRASYVFVVNLDYDNHRLAVDESIQYPNLTGRELTSLVLAVEPDRWVGAFHLNGLSVDGVDVKDYSLVNGRMDIPLINPLAAGESITLNLYYDLVLPWNGSAHIFGYNNWQINVVDWYPFIVPYKTGTGWLLHDPANVGEHLVLDSVDFDVTIQPKTGSSTLSIAASAPEETVENGLHFTLNQARTFVFSASSDYLTSSAMAGDVTVTSYYADGNQNAGEAILNATVQAIEIYSDVYGPYPYQSLSIVETFYPDGMEYDGMFYLSRDFYNAYNDTLLNNLIVIGIHEAAHQWWFGQIGNDQALEPWLDETLATYSERIFFERVSPGLMGIWWNFRVNDFQPAGKIDISIYAGGSFRPYTNAVYLRGAKFMENLRTRMGDESFLAFLKDYATQMAHKISTGDDFFRILYTHTSADISDIVATYFQNPH
ncbi:MAG: M1 family aminopeptidase [Chloroflexota bacterium]